LINIKDILSPFLTHHEANLANASDPVLAQCDLAYSKWLLGDAPFASEAAVSQFLDLLESRELAGTIRPGASKVNVHTTAYALGVLNLVDENQALGIAARLASFDWHWEALIAPDTLIPRWPWKYTHHSWRVSHWIGGSASIVASLWRLAPDTAEKIGLPRSADVLNACDSLIDGRTGLFRTYKSELLQTAFRTLYRVRHDPDAGDVGGIVHLHWVNYALGRVPYKAADALFDRAWKLMQKEPFMEKVPYCLDFDIVQIVRTANRERASQPHVRKRAERYAADIVKFFQFGVDSTYTLHKLPGALATLHECAMITDDETVAGLAIAPRDVMLTAYWI